MSHAVIRAGGKQFVVEEGQTIRVPSIEADAGSSIELETLLSSGDGKISATVVAHGKDQKIVVFKKKRRKQYKPVSYTHLRAHETPEHLVCRLLLEKKKII